MHRQESGKWLSSLLPGKGVVCFLFLFLSLVARSTLALRGFGCFGFFFSRIRLRLRREEGAETGYRLFSSIELNKHQCPLNSYFDTCVICIRLQSPPTLPLL